MADSLFVEMYAALHNSRYAAGKQFRPGQRMPKGYVFHNTSQDAAASIAAQGMEGGSFADRPGDFGGDAWLSVHQDDLPPAQSHQYGDLVAYEPQWQTDEQDQEGFPVYRRIHPSKIHLVDSKGRFLRSLAEPERYTEPRDTLAADDTPGPAPQLTPTAMPGLKIREPKPDRGWLLASGHTSDPAVLERLRGRAAKRGYDLDVRTIHTADDTPIHHVRVYGKKGQPLATDQAGKPEFFECGGEPQKYAADQPHYTETPEFKNWFGDSHVRHPETGKPLTVYHGTRNAGFRVFDQSQQGSGAGRRHIKGFYFTSHPLGAQTYSGTRDKAELSDDEEDRKPGNYAVHLSLQNPRHVDFEGRGWDGSGPDDHDPYFNIDRLVQEAIQDGHDGLIAHNINDEGQYGQGYGWGDTTYVAFHPHQIKSVDNRGTWSPDDERIDYDQQGNAPAVDEPEQYAADRDPPNLWQEAQGVTLDEFLDKHNSTPTGAHYDTDTDETLPEPRVHGYIDPRKVIPSEIPFDKTNPVNVDKMIKHLRGGGKLPPVEIEGLVDSGQPPLVEDGHHRTAAHMRAGITSMPFRYAPHTLAQIWAMVNRQPSNLRAQRTLLKGYEDRIRAKHQAQPEQYAARHWEDLANEIAASSENNPLVPEHASIRQGGKHWGSRWMDSDSFHQMEIPLSAIDWNPGYMESEEFRNHPPARTSGPIVIDNNSRKVGHTDEHGTPRLIVLDGQHRLRDARARGDQTIQAWVGEKAMQHIAPEQYAARPLRSSPGQIGLPFGDEHQPKAPIPRPEEPAPVPVDVQRPATGAGGGPGGKGDAPATGPVPHYSETPAFKSWFGGSKLRDRKTGRPLTLYHGTNSEVAEFRPFSHFGTAKAANDRYKHLRSFSEDVVGRDAGAFSIHPVHVRMENPLHMPDLASLDANTHQPYDEAMREFRRKYRTKKDRQRAEDNGEMPRVASWEDESDLSEYLYRQGIIEPEEFWEVQYSPQKAMELLKQKGYDGIIYNNAVEDPGNDSYIVFDPEQVKSATGNRGTWSRSDKRTTYTMPDAKAELYAAFWGAAFDVERYAKHKPQAGQKSLWSEEDHPREPEGTKGGHGGEFTEKKDGPTHEMATSPGRDKPAGSAQGAADRPGSKESRAGGQEGKPGPAGLTAQEAIAKAMEGSTRKTMSYEQACHATWLYNGTKPQDWSAVAVKEVRAVDDGKGGQVEMPIFDMPSGYDHAPVIFHGDSQNPCCELCSHQIKFVYWIKNDEAKQMMAVGSECVTGFGEGKSGKQLERETKATMNRDLLRQAWTAYDKLVEAFGYPVAKDVPQNEIANPDAIYWRLRDRSDLPRVNQLSPEDRQRADKMREAAQPIWKTFQDLRARLFTKQGVPVAADQRTHHHSYYHSAPGGRGGWRYAPHRHDPQPDGNVTRWVKKHGDDIRRLLDDVDLIFGQDQTAKYAMAFADAFVDRYAKLKPQRGQRSLFAEDDHPRGQPENAGEFRKKDAPGPVEKGSDAPSQKTPTGPVGKSSDAPTARDIQAKSHTVHDVVSGRVPVGVHSSKADEQVARDAGLYTTRVGKLLVYAKDQDAAAPVVQYLEAGGQYGTPEFSRLLHYSPDEIAEYQRFLESQGRHDLLSPPPAGTTGSRPGVREDLTGREADHIGDANKMVDPDIAGQDPDMPKAENVGKSAQVPTNPDIGGQEPDSDDYPDDDEDVGQYHEWIRLNPTIHTGTDSFKKSLSPQDRADYEELEDLHHKTVAHQGPEQGYKPYKFTPQMKKRYKQLTDKFHAKEREIAFASQVLWNVQSEQPVPAAVVDEFGINMPSGWKRIGDKYIKEEGQQPQRHRLTADEFAQMCVERYAERCGAPDSFAHGNCHAITAALLKLVPGGEAWGLFDTRYPDQIAHSAFRIPHTDVYLDAHGPAVGRAALDALKHNFDDAEHREWRPIPSDKVDAMVPGTRHIAIRKAMPHAKSLLRAGDEAAQDPERYAEQQARLFDDAGGAPRREFDERKHARETGTSGKFARKYPRVLSKEIQPALPGVDLPPDQRVVTKRRPVAQLPAGPAPQPAAYPVGHEFHTDPLVSNGGADHRVPVRIHKMDDTHAHIGYGDSPELGYKSDGHTFARIPREAVEQFVNDLQGRVAVPPDHHDPRIRMIASGQAKFLGKGDDGMAFDTGDHVVKVSTVVPFHWTNYHGTYTPEQAARTLRDQVALNNEMLDAGVPGLLRQGFFFHGGKGFAPMQKLQIPDQFEQQHIDQLRETLDAMHQRDYVLRDEVQAGLGPDGRAYMFDTGKAKKLEPGYRWAKDDKNSDRDHLKRLAERHGLQNPWAKDDANERYNDFDTRMIRHAQAIRDRTLDPALAARLMERGQKLFAELQAQDPEEAAAWEFPHKSNMDDLAAVVGTPDRHHMFASLWNQLLVDRYAAKPQDDMPRVFYRGTVPGSTHRIDEPFEAAKGKTFVARRPESAKAYGDSIEVVSAHPHARILYQETPEFWKLLGRRRPPNDHIASVPGGSVANVNRAIQAAHQAGYDAVSFSHDSDIGTVLLNEDAFQRGGAYQEPDQYARQPGLFDKPVTVETRPDQPGISLRDAVPPPSYPGLNPRQQARLQELLARSFRRTPAEQQEFQDLRRRVEEVEDLARQPVTREPYSQAPQHWTHDPTPPVDESQYVDAEEHHRRLYDFYRNQNASSRTTPSPLPNPPIGSWRMEKHFGIYGREIEQLRMVPVHELTLSEGDYTDPRVNDEGRGDDARRYAGWMKQHGIEHLPPIHVVETDQGTHRVMNGHRRTAAAKLAGLTHIPAWVSPRMKTGKKYYGQDLDIGTGLTYEGAHHGAEAASKMYEERQRQLSERIRAERAAAEQHLQPGTPDRYAAPETNEFRQWFGQSHAAHPETKQPLVYYHGTNPRSAEALASGQPWTKRGGLYGWFDTDPERASGYAVSFDQNWSEKPDGAVLPVYLSIQNPKRFRNEYEFPTDENAIEELRRQGYDGVMSPNTAAVFDRSQIKSATGNSGNFSRMDERITHSQPGRPERYRDPATPEQSPATGALHHTQTPEFKRFFGDWEAEPHAASKVVHPEGHPRETHEIEGTGSHVKGPSGKPMAVYHGTGHGGFDRFDLNKVRGGNLYGKGFYFTEDKSVASQYEKNAVGDEVPDPHRQEWVKRATEVLNAIPEDSRTVGHRHARIAIDRVAKGDGLNHVAWAREHAPEIQQLDSILPAGSRPETKQVYLNIRRPFDMDDHIAMSQVQRDFGPHIAKRIESDYSNRIEQTLGWGEDSGATVDGDTVFNAIADHARDTQPMKVNSADYAAYQIQKAGYDGITHIGGDRMGGGHHHRVWIAFRPHQIKSVQNRGTWDPEDERMDYEQQNEPVAAQYRQAFADAFVTHYREAADHSIFRDLLDLQATIDRYKAKESPGQQHLFDKGEHDVSDEPRDAGGRWTRGGMGGSSEHERPAADPGSVGVDTPASGGAGQPIPDPAEYLRGLFADRAHREMMSRALDRPRDELQRLRDDRNRRRATNQAMLPPPTAILGPNEQLVTKAKAGDRQAMADLWDANRGVVAKTIRGFHLREQDIQDAMQDAFMAAFAPAVRNFDPALGFRFTTYLTKAVSSFMSRRKQRERGTEKHPRPKEISGAAPEDRPTQDPAASPEPDRLESDERAQAMEEALRKIKPKYQTIVRWIYGIGGEQLSEVEIAARTGMKKQQVSWIKHRALEILRDQLADRELYRQAFRDAVLERYGIADAILKWAAPRPPEPSEAVKQRAQALGEQLRQPKPKPLPEPQADEFDLKYPKMPAMRQARETLDALHNTADLQKRADPVAFKLADQETRARRDSEAWQNAYERHIGNVRQQIHGELKAKVPDLLKAAREEHAHHQRMSQQVMGLGRSIEQQMQDLDKEDPGHQYLKKRLAEMKPILRGHRQLIDSTIQDLETRGAPDAIPEPEQWVNPRVQRQRERQDIQDHRRRVKELERAGQDVTGPTGDRIADERDPAFRQAIRDRHLEFQRNRPAPAPAPAPRPARGTPGPQAPTDSAGWLDHATEMVHRATTDTQLDARAKSIALTNWRREMPNVSPKSNPAFARYYAAARKQAHGEYQAAARQALDQATQWHQQTGEPIPAQLQALEARLSGKPVPRGPTGYEDAQPTTSRVDQSGNEITAAQMGARKAAETRRKNEQERKAKEHQTRNPEVPRPSDIPAHLDELPEGLEQSPHLSDMEKRQLGRLYGFGGHTQVSFTDLVNGIIRSQGGHGADYQPPEADQQRVASQVAEKVRDAIGRHRTATAAAQYGMDPKEYDQIARQALQEEIDQARATNGLIDSLHSAKMQAELDSGKDHSVMLKGFNRLAEPTLRDAGIAGVTDSNAMQKAQEILERGKVPVPGPHDDRWHEAVQEQLGPPDEPLDLTSDEWDRGQDAADAFASSGDRQDAVPQGVGPRAGGLAAQPVGLQAQQAGPKPRDLDNEEWDAIVQEAVETRRPLNVVEAEYRRHKALGLNPDDLDPEAEAAGGDEPVPFTARHSLRRELYHALAGLARQPAA